MKLTNTMRREFHNENIILRKKKDTDCLTKIQEKYLIKLEEDGFITWLIILKAEKKIIGTISAKIISVNSRVIQFTSTIVGKEERIDYSQYRIEALKILADYAIDNLNFNRLQIICPTNNRDCETTAVQAGFLKETNLKEYYYDDRIDLYITCSVFSRFSHPVENILQISI